MAKKLSLFISFSLILALCFSVAVSAERATVDMSKVTATGPGEPDNGFTPDAIFDGDEFTRWGSMQAGESVTAVFDQVYHIQAVEIRFFRAGVREHLYTFEYSLDGSNWTEIKSTKAHSTADEDLAIFGEEDGYMETFPLVETVAAQHFRYTYEGRNDGATIGSVWEMYFILGEAPAAPVAVEEPAAAPVVVAEAPAVAPAPAPVTPAPAQAAPAPAPSTADPISIIVIGSLISAAGVVIARKRK